MKTVGLPNGVRVPALGLGTWRMGEEAGQRKREIAAVRLALEIGYRLIDTAEMYGEGGAEEVVGAALAAAIAAGTVRREEVFVVTKVYPHNASRKGAVAACERSLARLGIDSADLYLLHWPGQHPLADTLAAFEALEAAGRIGAWGVSNFDVTQMQALAKVKGGERCAANQVYYSASERGIEFDLLGWQRQRAIPTMAYCPIDQGALATDAPFARVGKRHGVSAAHAALAWVMRQPDLIAIPKAVREAHLRDNLTAVEITLTEADLAEIDAAYAPPRKKQRLAMA